MNAKRSFLIVGIVALASFGALAQSTNNTPAPPVPIVPGSPGTPAVNTNGASFTNITVEIYSGYSYVSGQTSASQSKTGAYYDLFNGFGPCGEIANEASGNVIAEMDGYFEYHKRTGSLEPIVGIGGGYNWDDRAMSVKGKVGVNYNLTQIGGYFGFVGVQGIIGKEFNSGNSRPSLGGFFDIGVAF